MTEEDKKELNKIVACDNVSCLCLKDNLFDYLDNNKLMDFINKFHNNSKKWIRVRQTNDKTTIAVKHILVNKGGWTSTNVRNWSWGFKYKWNE